MLSRRSPRRVPRAGVAAAGAGGELDRLPADRPAARLVTEAYNRPRAPSAPVVGVPHARRGGSPFRARRSRLAAVAGGLALLAAARCSASGPSRQASRPPKTRNTWWCPREGLRRADGGAASADVTHLPAQNPGAPPVPERGGRHRRDRHRDGGDLRHLRTSLVLGRRHRIASPSASSAAQLSSPPCSRRSSGPRTAVDVPPVGR